MHLYGHFHLLFFHIILHTDMAKVYGKMHEKRTKQGRAEDFIIGVVLTLFACQERDILFIATPKFPNAIPNFRLFGVALRIRCGTRPI